MRIVVTGGAGFIGSHLCERLLKDGHSVFCIDNFVSGNYQNIKEFEKHPSFHLMMHDITVPLKEDLGDVDQIYHLASPSSPIDYVDVPLQTLWVNAAGTKLMLEIASKKGCGFLLASTSEIYGEALVNPVPENYFGNVDSTGEKSSYSEGKRFAESMAMTYYKDFRFPLKIVRIFNTYGPKMRKRDGKILPAFISSALLEEPIRVSGDGQKTDVYCYIDDLIDSLIMTMNQKGMIGPMNLGNDQAFSLQTLAEKIVAMTKSTSLIVHDRLPEDDLKKLQPDLTLAFKTIGYKPKIGIDEGLRRTIDYFKN